MAEFDDREDGSLNLLDLVCPQKREKEPQEEYRIPPRVMSLRNKLEIFYRLHDDTTVLQKEHYREHKKLITKLRFYEEQIQVTDNSLREIERKIRKTKECLKAELQGL